jgi:hypothetical protein
VCGGPVKARHALAEVCGATCRQRRRRARQALAAGQEAAEQGGELAIDPGKAGILASEWNVYAAALDAEGSAAVEAAAGHVKRARELLAAVEAAAGTVRRQGDRQRARARKIRDTIEAGNVAQLGACDVKPRAMAHAAAVAACTFGRLDRALDGIDDGIERREQHYIAAARPAPIKGRKPARYDDGDGFDDDGDGFDDDGDGFDDDDDPAAYVATDDEQEHAATAARREHALSYAAALDEARPCSTCGESATQHAVVTASGAYMPGLGSACDRYTAAETQAQRIDRVSRSVAAAERDDDDEPPPAPKGRGKARTGHGSAAVEPAPVTEPSAPRKGRRGHGSAVAELPPVTDTGPAQGDLFTIRRAA